MIILSKSKKCVVNLDNVEKIYVGGDNASIKTDMKSGRGTELAKYNSVDGCKTAMDMLVYALRNGDNVFEFPNESEMTFGTQHTSKVTSMKKSHGGS